MADSVLFIIFIVNDSCEIKSLLAGCALCFKEKVKKFLFIIFKIDSENCLIDVYLQGILWEYRKGSFLNRKIILLKVKKMVKIGKI